MKAERAKIILVIMLLIGGTTASWAGASTVYYVSVSGDNANSGVALNKPLRSINAAIAKAAAGDTIYVLPGTYRELVVLSAKKGLPENPICLMGLSTKIGDYPVIDGGALKPSSDASFDWMSIADCEWVEFARLTFRNGWTFPIKVDRSSYLTFRSCQFWGGKRVINASSPTTHHILVEDCFWDQGGDFLWRVERDTAGMDAWTSMHHGAMAYFNGSLIDFHGTGGSMVIRRNTVMNAFQAVRYRGENGFDSNVEMYENHVSNMRDNDFEPEYYTYNLHIYHNVSHNIHKTLSVDNVEGGKIYYYGNVSTADSDAWSQKICSGLWKIQARPRFRSFPVYAFNNSFYSSGLAFMKMSGRTEKLKHFNNAYLFFGQGGWQLSDWDPSNVFDYDISNRSWPKSLSEHGQEAHGSIGEIQAVDPAGGDMRLKPGSPGIDAGIVMRFPDLDWTQSFSGKGPDIGAYENGRLVEGPPFRFLVPPDANMSYKEKPRIVRGSREGANVVLYFSEAIDPSSVTPADLEIYSGDNKLTVVSTQFPRTNFELVIKTQPSSDSGELSLLFKRLPTGKNGERATTWASAVKIRKTAAGTK